MSIPAFDPELSSRGRDAPTITTPHVLVCEDEGASVDEIEEYFREDGIDVTIARDGLEASCRFEAAPAGTFSVVLTDLHMPKRDGADLAREVLAAAGEADAVEVIVMSGHGAEMMRSRQHELGLFAVLQKPLNLAELAAMVQQAHRAAMARRAAARIG